MTSTRIFLVVALLATITLTVFISTLHGYRSSMHEAQLLFDARLADVARLLAAVHDRDAGTEPVTGGSGRFAYQVWLGETLGQHSENAPSAPIARRQPGYQYSNFGDFRWRTYVLHDALENRWIMTAERVDVRDELAENMILKSVLPVVVSLPIVGLLIWFIVGYGLYPLRRLAAHLHDKRADDLSPLPDEAQPRELAQVVTSINDLLQRLESSFTREKRFAADAAHELRTPVSAMKIHIHNLARELPEDSQSLQQLEESASRMQNLVEQLLALYRTAPDQVMLQFRKLNLHAIVKDCIAREYRQLEQKHLQLELEGEDAYIEGDRTAIETLVKNLLDNAGKYTPMNGRIEVTIQRQKNRVLLQVQDSGPGIPSEQRARVFDRFYRLDGDRHASGIIGCGLGLSIVRHVADLHDASVTLSSSRFDSGLSVTVAFPAYAAAENVTERRATRSS